jgi:hypothetical protein
MFVEPTTEDATPCWVALLIQERVGGYVDPPRIAVAEDRVAGGVGAVSFVGLFHDGVS